MEAAVVFDNLVKNCDRNDLPAECEQMRVICDGGTPSVADRLSRLRDSGKLEAPAEAVLKYLGELKRLYLTEFEERLLSFIELECGINNSQAY